MKTFFEQRRFWPPSWDLVAVTALAVVLAVWPVFDPTWCHKVPYALAIGLLMLVACVLSAQERWVSEERYRRQLGLIKVDIRGETIRIMIALRRIELSVNDPPPPAMVGLPAGYVVVNPTIADHYSDIALRVLDLIYRYAELEIPAPDDVLETVNPGPRTVADIQVLVAGFQVMMAQLRTAIAS
jgi:hypothetical protein